jgi:non-homologous end joining protein Ku
LLPEDLDLAFLNANRKCILLSVRVYDDEIRKQAQLFRTMTMNASSAKNERDALALIGQSMDLLPTLHEKIGERLRKIDDDEEQKTS